MPRIRRLNRKIRRRPVRSEKTKSWGAVLCALALLGGSVAARSAAAQGQNSIQPVGGRGARQEFELSLNKGEQEVLPASGVKTYSEGTEGIIDVRLTGD